MKETTPGEHMDYTVKLSKKSSAIQRSIQKAVASGKALGGLLVGIAAAVAGCREHHSPASTMGRFPDPRYQENATNETRNRRAIPGEPTVPQPGGTNAANECKNGEIVRTQGISSGPVKDGPK